MAVAAGSLRLATDASLYSNGRWVSIDELQKGDIIQAADGRKVRITNISDVTPIPHNGCRPPKRRRV